MSASLKKEIEHWLFLESWDGFLPWRSEKHIHISLSSDASGFAWGGTLGPNAIAANVYDYWEASTLRADIATKETLALNNVLMAFGDTIRNFWVDAFVDSQTLIHSWSHQRSRSQPLIDALKKLFITMMALNIDLHLTFVPSSENPADAPSRNLKIDSYIGKLRSMFKEIGRAGDWNSMLGLVNPAASPEVHAYLKACTEEHLRAHIVPKQAVPLFLPKLLLLSRFFGPEDLRTSIEPVNNFYFGA